MDKLIVSSAPHIHGRDTGRGIMLDVIIALLPAAAAAGPGSDPFGHRAGV